MYKILLAITLITGAMLLPAQSAFATDVGIQCERLETSVKVCSKKNGTADSKLCTAKTKKFKKQCVNNEVCGQPKFSCEKGFLCAQVMPAVKTYSSLKELKAAKAYFLYYGECLADQVY